ncbi:Flagellar basal body protein FlaE [Selenomonas ruminantium]|uniref:Flagellar basal body protein FlaE n=1 Tax=Selenomonas ruminantium TaxID=971 RepID=A0A1H0QWE1_SELRU|nr:Flagellar basal body protein FlaE [Selenomonas ruminantium]
MASDKPAQLVQGCTSRYAKACTVGKNYLVPAFEDAQSARPSFWPQRYQMTLTMSDGSTVTQTSGTYTVGYSLPITTMVTVYDTLGNTHSLPIYFTRTEVLSSDSTTVNGNTWTISLDTLCNRDMTASTDSTITCSIANASDTALASTLVFSSGSIDKSNTNLYISAVSGGTSTPPSAGSSLIPRSSLPAMKCLKR